MVVRSIDPTPSVNGRASALWLSFVDMHARAGYITSALDVFTAVLSMNPKGVVSSESIAPSEYEPKADMQ